MAGAISNLSVDDEIEQQIATQGGIDSLIEASRAHVGNVKVHTSAAQTSLILTATPTSPHLSLLITLISPRSPHTAQVQARVVRALTNLSVHEANKNKIATVKGIQALIGASLEHGDSAEVQAGVAGALRNLSVSVDIAQVVFYRVL